ncbi:MAG TPA: RraA family protein [Vicinamibacterales bacterium]|nr:RraA family protein [Vicinamibacterales bacterium]
MRTIQRPGVDGVRALAGCYTAFILDHLGKYGAMTRIAPLSPGMQVCGPAVTSLGPDLTVRRMAIDLAQPGDVLVVAAGGVEDYACFGDGTARRMILKSMAGAVIDGATRDARFLRELAFPTFVRAVTPRNYHYPVSAEFGAVNVPIVCGGVTVHPGDLIVGDDDGVIVIPRESADSLAAILPQALEAERVKRQAATRYEPFAVDTELLERGYQFE